MIYETFRVSNIEDFLRHNLSTTKANWKLHSVVPSVTINDKKDMKICRVEQWLVIFKHEDENKNKTVLEQ